MARGKAPVLRGVDLEVPAGTRTVLVGPSGAGKTTLLRAIAGLQSLDGGAIELGSTRIDRLPAHRRHCAVVFQEPRLLPHLDAAENVAFAMRAAGVPRRERRARAKALLGDVGLDGFDARRVNELSGGEQQRIALARALCADPQILLLDEPLSAVDANRREDLRALIARLQQERQLTTLFVTHDRAEAAQLGQRVALMLEGTIVQHDEPRVLFERPSSPIVAKFFGSTNILRGVVHSGLMLVGDAAVAVPGPDGEACVTIRPERVRLDPAGPLELQVLEAIYTGAAVRLRLGDRDLRLEATVAPAEAPVAGDWVRISLPIEDVWRIPLALPSSPDGEQELDLERWQS
ncbi:MAG: ABC transporter ATP-binding protein [Solirubrobacterales bacterium]